MPLLAGLEPGRGRERGLDASHSLFHSFQQLFFEHLLLRAEDLQPKDTASGGSSSEEDSTGNPSLPRPCSCPGRAILWLPWPVPACITGPDFHLDREGNLSHPFTL